MPRKKKTMDGNTAAAHASYAFTEVAAIYPITPSSPMAEITDTWSADGLRNIFGDKVSVIEMQSEGGASGAVHGSLNAGALTTTYTASQGLLLMIPNMYKMAGELLPSVINVSARTVAAHALSIFGDHGDIYACRQTGYAMLAESNVQEVMDLTPEAHLAALKGRVPFVNFFDGFRTSHEIQKIEVWDFEELADMMDKDALDAFRARALNPKHPTMRGSHQNPDIFFQNREAANKYYDAVPAIVEEYMGQVNKKLGTDYGLFNYYGASDAERVIIAMGSFCDVTEEVIDYLTAAGEKVGLVKVRLYRPFSAEHLAKVIPASCKKIAVMDRTKEPGALAEPLMLDVMAALRGRRDDITLVGGRYGLSSKDTTPSSVFAVYENLEADAPKNGFTIGIVDDVTNLSLPERSDCADTTPKGTINCKFWGLGGDGTVGANKNSIKILGDHTDKYVQAYFQYDSKKTGGVTVSHLRFGDKPIKAPYYVRKADFVACHNPSYIIKGFKMVRDCKPGGKFLVNAQWTPEELEQHLPPLAKKYVADNNIEIYLVNAIDIARKIGMGKRTNTILQSAFFKLAGIIPMEDARKYMKDAALKSYGSKGEAVVNANYAAIDAGMDALVKVEIPASWKDCEPRKLKRHYEVDGKLGKMVKEIMDPVNYNDGDSIPVSAFVDGHEDGTFQQGASAYEKRGVAVDVPEWDETKCIQCNQCSYVCPHATIRPFALDENDVKNLPEGARCAQMKGKGAEAFQFVQAVSPLDCMGCGVCAAVCPAPGKALTMKPQESQAGQQKVFDYCVENVAKKPGMMSETSVKGSQFNQPLLEFSGSCAGCAETAYARLVTQLYGERMYISNATGCSSIWGGPAATSPYTVSKSSGHGPAWANSLFEDNAENGYGMYLGQKAIRERLRRLTEEMIAVEYCDAELKAAAQNWLDTYDNGKENTAAADAFIKELEESILPVKEAIAFLNTDDAKNMFGEHHAGMTAHMNELDAKGVTECDCEACSPAARILAEKEYLNKKSVWIFGGDGWAYDIGYGGLDHVLASGEDVNVFVFDTEVYSNTGGQASKASQIGQVAQFAAAGKNIGKKSLAEMAMAYGYVYVAQIAMGADQNQTIKAIAEAEAYPGPSLIIGYSPCEMHGIKGGMVNCQSEMKAAVAAGYWFNFRFDPRKKAEGANPFQLDSKEPTGSYLDFIGNETRYSRLKLTFPDRAETLFSEAVDQSKERYQYLLRLSKLYEA